MAHACESRPLTIYLVAAEESGDRNQHERGQKDARRGDEGAERRNENRTV